MRRALARNLPPLVLAVCVAGGTASSVLSPVLRAQIAAVNSDVKATKGQIVSPVYEGWYELDGTVYGLFGYYNPNTEEVVDIPVGPQNKIEPGSVDQGQPTRFFPGRQYGVFTIALPKDRPKTEITWTLAIHGQTMSIPSFLDPLYVISPQREYAGSAPGNTPPVLKFDPSGQSAQGPRGMTVKRSATVSGPLTLEVWVTDDGLPPPPPVGRGRGAATSPPPAPARGGAATLRRGLAVAWSVYRGPGSVSLSSLTPEIEGGKASTTATFSEAGNYTLRVLATDGSRSQTKCCWTNGYVEVVVAPGGPSR